MNIYLRNSGRLALRTMLALSLILTLSAFRSTDVEGYTDPDFAGFRFHTVVLQLQNAPVDFKQYVVKRMTDKLGKENIRVLLHEDLFPPTRQWDEQSSAAIYARHGVDAGIIVTLGSAGGETTPGMVMYNATTIGGTTTGYATQMSVARDHASFEIAVVDAKTKRTAWIGNLSTRGAGLLFVGPKDTAKSLVKGLIKEWKAAGHID